MPKVSENPEPYLNLAVDLAFEEGLTQKEKILRYLDDFGPATYRELHNRLMISGPRARISEMKRDGREIETSEITRKGRTFKVHDYNESD
jgi:hypothetical protein